MTEVQRLRALLKRALDAFNTCENYYTEHTQFEGSSDQRFHTMKVETVAQAIAQELENAKSV